MAEASKSGWIVISMKNDRKTIFPAEKNKSIFHPKKLKGALPAQASVGRSLCGMALPWNS
jgi:hypothetical protein